MNNYQEKVLTYINGNEMLKDYFKYYLNYCLSTTLPYHNTHHTFKMMYHMINIYESKKYDLKEYDLLVLLVSALYHDFDHSGGKFTDRVNVLNAITAFENASDNILVYYDDSYFVENFKEDVEDCINATEYPYRNEDVSCNIRMEIIRECDIISQIHDDIFTHAICGLKTELNGQSWKECISNYTTFLGKMISDDHMKLEYCKQYVSDNIKTALNIIQKLTETFA